MREFIKRITVKKLTTLLAVLLALCLGISAFFAVGTSLADTANDVTTETENPVTPEVTVHEGEGDRVSMLELMERYPVDYVLGPVDVVNVNGDKDEDGNDIIDNNDLDTTRFTYIEDEDHYERDSAGNPVLDSRGNHIYTNNTYGIPASQYFDVENYIYTEPIEGGGRTLYGWKPNIYAVEVINDVAEKTIAQTGAIMEGDTASDKMGIYVCFSSGLSGTTIKYALIVPSDIKAVGTGSGAFVTTPTNGTQTSYYSGTPSQGYDTLHSYTSGQYVAKYTDFSCFIMGGVRSSVEGFWQPRERLVGVYFPEDSQLETIADATNNIANAIDKTGGNRTSVDDIGQSAFTACDNLRFFILPSKNEAKGVNGVQSIGKYAFYRSTQLVDINIPSSVKTIGDKAYMGCNSIQHLSIPAVPTGGSFSTSAFDECSKLKDVIDLSGVYETKFKGDKFDLYKYSKENVKNNVIYTLGGKPVTNAGGTIKYDTGGNGVLFIRNPNTNKWSAQGLAGRTGEDPNKVFVFPSKEDFNDQSDRRRGIRYDYIDCDGGKTFSDFKGVTAPDEYDIAENFAKDTWCINLVIPKEVKTIGANAFYNAHVRYLETYATNIGDKAFASNTDGDQQWYYFHKEKVDGEYVNDYNISSSAFGGFNNKRYIVYEDYAMSQAIKLADLGLNKDGNTTRASETYYQIPVVATIENKDSAAVSVDTSDMDGYFFNDSDYLKNPEVGGESSGTITYTKRLSGHLYNEVKLATGGWGIVPSRSEFHEKPVLSNMTSTVWYSYTNYEDSVGLSNVFSSSVPSINLYTKNVAAPTLIDKEFIFGDSVQNGVRVEAADGIDYIGDKKSSISFYNALGLDDIDNRDNFIITKFGKVLNASGGEANEQESIVDVRNAGTYTLKIELDPTRWGVWKEDYASSFKSTAKVTVSQKNIAIDSLDDIPQFKVAGEGGETLRGNSDTLYRYTDGYYLTQQTGMDPISTSQISNGYTFLKDGGIDIELDKTHALFTQFGDAISIDPVSQTALVSGDYYSVYTITVNPNSWGNYNYNFDPDKLFSGDTDYGITVNARETQRYRITKHWFVVIQTNMFVDSEVDVVPGSTPQQYVAVIDGSGNAHYELVYEESGYNVRTPKLAYNNESGELVAPTMEIKFTPYGEQAATTLAAAGTPVEAANADHPEYALAYYINSAMPAGLYEIIISAGEVTGYKAISTVFKITVAPKDLNAEKLAAIHEALNAGNAYALAGKQLHDNPDTFVDELNGTLNIEYRNNAADTYWADKADYYSTAVEVTYKLNGASSATYYNYSDMLGLLGEAGEYTLFYKIAAKNYVTYGGEEQDKKFNTVLYNAISLKEFYKYITAVDGLYFKNVVYTGATVHPNVPTSQYYKYDFLDQDGAGNDLDYINVRQKASVTLSLYDAKLARWNNDTGLSAEELAKYFEIDGANLRVFFDIVAAENSWDVVPQMPSWSFNGFDAKINTVTAGLKFTGVEVKYALIPVSVGPDDVEYGDDDAKAAGVVFFTVDADGKVTDPDTVKLLNAIKPDEYYLKSYVGARTYKADGSDDQIVNVRAFDFVQELNGNYVTSVSVAKAANRWTLTPNVIRWTWGAFDVEVNTITATSLYPALLPDGYETFSYGANLPVTTYSIVRKVTSEDNKVTYEDIAGLSGFHAVTDPVKVGEKDTTVKDILAELPAGTYVLRTSLGESDYYTAIDETEHEFRVFVANNSWDTTPGVTGWQYKGFTEENFIFGVPKYGDKTQVQYTLSGGKYTDEVLKYSVDDKGVLKLSDDAVTVLTGLEVLKSGHYTVKAYIEGNSNYNALPYEATFTVIKANNSWTTTPGMTGWTYETFTLGNFTPGAPALNDVADRKVTYTLYKNGEKIYEFTEMTADEKDAVVAYFKKLDAYEGSYTLTAFLQGTDNYDNLSLDITFRVTKVTNTWDATPGMTSWQYSRFDANSNFIKGTPVYIGKTTNGEVTVNKPVYYGVFDTAMSKESFIAALKDGENEYNKYIFTAITDDIDKYLKEFETGKTYYFCAYVEGGDNFSDLWLSQLFTISSTSNAWDNVAAITGWTYSELTEQNVGNYVSAGKAEFGDIYYTVQKVDADGNIVTGNAGIAISARSFDDLKTELLTLGAGSYNLYIASEKTDNYAQAEHNIRFTVAKAANEWREDGIPSLDNGWIYGEYDATVNAPKKGVTKFDSDKYGEGEGKFHITYKYYAARQVNGEWIADTDNKITDIANASAGTYALVVEAEATDNYTALKHTSIFTISKKANEWQIEPDGTASWTWGDDISASKLVNASVKFTEYSEDDEGNKTPLNPVVYTINGVVKTLDEIKGLGAGSYEIVVSVADTANYAGKSMTVYVTVSPADFNWTQEPADAEWTWDTGKNEEFPAAAAEQIQGTGDFKITYTVGEEVYTYDKLVELLDKAGTYAITVTVHGTNYNDLVKEIIVTVNLATNVWTENEPAESLTKQYGDKETRIKVPTAKYGTENGTEVKYYIGETEYSYDDLLAELKNAPASNTPYMVYTCVAAKEGHYGELRTLTKYTVTGRASTWANKAALDEQGTTPEFTYGNAITRDNFVLPIGEMGTGKVTYELSAFKADGSPISGSTATTTDTDDVFDWIKRYGDVGKFIIKSTYKPNDESYETLVYTITASIVPAQVKAGVVLDEEYTGYYKGISIPTPTVSEDGYKAGMIITVGLRSSSVDTHERVPAGKTLQEYINNELGVGDYIVTYYVPSDDNGNYIGLEKKTARVIISPVVNSWQDVGEITTEKWNEGYSWTFKRGETIDVVLPESVIGDVVLTFNSESNTFENTAALNKYLNEYDNGKPLAAGTYTLRFSVTGNNNYNGLVSNCTLVIEKKENKFTSVPKYTGDGKGSVKAGTLGEPVADVRRISGVDLLRFDVVKAGDSSANETGISYNDYKDLVFANGTYTITMYIGGAISDTDSSYESALALYLADYDRISASFTITLAPDSNSWTTPFTGNSWVWGTEVNADGGEVTITMPEAAFGNATMVYTVKNGDSKLAEFRADKFTSDQNKQAFAELVAYLNGRGIGTYTVTATIAATDTYNAPEAATAIFTVSAAPNEWSDKFADKSKVEWTYKAENNTVIAFSTKHGGTITVLVNNVAPTADMSLNDYLKTLNAGTHTISVSVDATENYSGISKSITLEISPANNSWKGDFTIGSTFVWGNVTGFTAFAAPDSGNTVTVSVYKVGENDSQTLEFTLSLSVSNNVVDYRALNTRLAGLDAGSYTVVAEVAASTNYKALTKNGISFEVTKATNKFNTVPNIAGNSWTYGTAMYAPSSEPLYGNANDVVYSYAVKGETAAKELDESAWTTTAPTAAGEYYIRGVLAGNGNYADLVDYGTFTIVRAKNDWVVNPGVTAWSWNSYDKSVNLFRGSAVGSGAVTFVIKVPHGAEYVSLIAGNFSGEVTDEQLALINGGFTLTSGVVSDEIAELLKLLNPTNYQLSVTAAEDNYYNALSYATTFTVSPAKDGWKTRPGVMAFVYGEFVQDDANPENNTFTAGETSFGAAVTYTLKDGKGNVVEDTKNVGIAELISGLSVDTYTLEVTAADGATYEHAETITIVFKVTPAQNSWKENCAPATSTSVTYVNLHNTDTVIGDIFAEPVPASGNVTYSILNSRQGSLGDGYSDLGYDELLAKLQSLDSDDYIIRSTVQATDNHLSIFGDTSIAITREGNAFKNFPAGDSASGSWNKNNTTTIDLTAIEADHGDVVYTYGGKNYNYTDLLAELKKQNAGTFNVTVSVAQTNEYNGLSKLLTVVIRPADNGWSVDGWKVEDSLSAIEWKYNEEVTWAGVEPLYGTTVNVSITKENATSALNYFTITVGDTFATQMDNVSAALKALNAGTYTFTVSVAADTNWSAIDAASVDITVNKTENGWTTLPNIGNSVWQFSSNMYEANSAPWYGSAADVEYSYAVTTEDAKVEDIKNLTLNWTSEKPVTSGYYFIKGELKEGANYLSLVGYGKFRITLGQNGWTVQPGVTAWSWDNYSASVNLFRGLANNNGAVTYKIVHEDGTALTLNDFCTVTGGVNGTITEDRLTLINNGFTLTDGEVSKAIEAILKALKPEDYTLQAIVAADGSYDGMTTSVQITVNDTSNEWTTRPGVMAFVYGAQSIDFTAGVTKYPATISYRLTDDSNNEVSNPNNLTIEELIKTLPVGTYNLCASAAADADGKYSELTEISVLFKVTQAENGWSSAPTPNINKTYIELQKVAAIGDIFAQPKAKDENDVILYTILTSDQSTVKAENKTYGQLLDELKKLDSGDYIIRSTVQATKNHLSIFADTSVSITREDNEFTGLPAGDKVEAEWNKDGTEIELGEVKALGKGKLTFTYGGIGYDSAAGLAEAMKGFGAATYNVTVSVEQTNEYNSLTKVIAIEITPAKNAWSDKNWTVENSVSANKWTWNSDVTWTGVAPVYGDTINVTVIKSGASSATNYFTITTNDEEEFATQIRNVNAALKALNAGTYTLTVSAPAGTNWSAIAGQSVTLTVDLADNGWDTDPKINSAENKWTYGTTMYVPTSAPEHGNAKDVVYSYAKTTADAVIGTDEQMEALTWVTEQPTEAGYYFIRGVLASDGNYAGLTGYGKFEIVRAENKWVDEIGVTAWSWDNFVSSVNLFRGSATNGGEVTFTITHADGTALTAADFSEAFADGGVITLSFTVNGGAVTGTAAEMLKALMPNTYLLSAVAAANEYYGEASDSVTFTVAQATNEWTTRPTVSSFVYNAFDDNNTFTAGVAKHGTVVYVLTGSKGEIVDTNNVGIKALIKGLPIDTYTLQVSAAADTDGKYGAAETVTIIFRVTAAENKWNAEPVPSITKTYLVWKDAATDIKTLFTKATVLSGEEVKYTLLRNDQSSMGTDYTSLSYNALIAKLEDLGSGEYIIRSFVSESSNYLAIEKDTSLSITRVDNEFTTFPANDKVTGSWGANGTNNLANLANAQFVDKSGSTDVTFTYSGVVYNSLSTLVNAMKNLNAGTYYVTAGVAQSNAYNALTRILTVVIDPATNTWSQSWKVEESIKLNGKIPENMTWEWNSAVVWTGVAPVYGETINVSIMKSGASSALHYFTISTKDNFATQMNNVSSALSALDAGTYTVSVSAPAGTNWTAIAAQTVTVTLTQTNNGWKEEAPPVFVDSNGNTIEVNTETGAVEWDYGTATKAMAEAVHGDYTVYYYDYDGSDDYKHYENEEAYETMPVDSGNYIAFFRVNGTNEYAQLNKNIQFKINPIEYKAYSVVPSIVSWTWDQYTSMADRIKGIALSGGTASYTVYRQVEVKRSRAARATETTLVPVAGLEDIRLVDETGKVNKDISKNIYIPSRYTDLLNGLTAGNYTLRATFDPTRNYIQFTEDVPFTIDVVQNRWTTPPSVESWYVNHWTEKNEPVAESLYGHPNMVIVSTSGEIEVYRKIYNKATGEYDVMNILNRAGAGKYTLYTWVDGEEGKYTEIERNPTPVTVFFQGSDEDKNTWAVTPSIESWNARLDITFDDIVLTGTPYRGLAYFDFYEAVMENGIATGELGALVTAGDDSLTVNDLNTYYKEFYIPMKPGTYYMVARAVYEVNGVPVEADNLSDRPRLFQVGYRANSFTQDVRISTLLYLGEKDIEGKWQPPTASAANADSVITYAYYDSDGKLVGNEIPQVAGTYKLVATASAKYCQDLTSEIEFTVSLSQNSWVNDKSPTIESWSEEYNDISPDPVGEAKYGEVKYTYANVLKPDVIYTEKPTEEGTYIMYATVELEGYEKLESTYTFTIEPEFDRTFVIIDILLGIAACACAVVVIIFAIRRYKENG